MKAVELFSYKVSKTINAPLRFVYNWCTDYRETDPEIVGSKTERRILERTKKRVIYVQLYDGEDGRKKVALDIVSLKPPTSWHLDYFAEEDDETGEYRLKSLGRDRTRLDMTFKEKWKNMPRIPSIEEEVKHTNEIWDKYIAALEREYSETR